MKQTPTAATILSNAFDGDYTASQAVADRVAYSDTEMEARRRKTGLWSDPAAMPPWGYRKHQGE